MSHYCVHVLIADDEPYDDLDAHLSNVLAPYDENLICEERASGSLSDDEVAEELEKYGLNSAEEYFNGYLGDIPRRNEEDNGWDLFTTTNLDAKWDWWVIGGRFEGTLLGGNGTTAYVDDLNAEEAVEIATREANALYDRLEAATAGMDAPVPFTTLQEQYDDAAQARQAYLAQPWIEAASSLMSEVSWLDPMYFFHQRRGGRDPFVLERASIDVPFAYVDIDGKWHSAREMGWFGLHTELEGHTYREYVDGYRAYVKSLPGDCEVAVVDMHI